MKAASIDLGTNTFRLLAVEKGEGCHSIKVLVQKRAIVRMGEGLATTGMISPQARNRAFKVLEDFRDTLKDLGIERCFPVATSVFREARNAEEFLVEASRILGCPIRVISGEEEARLTLLGGLWDLEIESGILFDIGGGSTEFILFSRRSPLKLVSTPLGVVKLTEAMIHHDPPTPREVERIRAQIRKELKEVTGVLGSRAENLVGTAGTVTTLAAIDLELSIYDHQKVHGHRLTRDRIEDLLKIFLSLSRKERLKIKGMEEGREDLIIPGTLITLETMENWGQKELVVSDLGLREGALIDGLGCR